MSLPFFVGFALSIELLAVWLFFSAWRYKVQHFLWGILGLFFLIEAVMLPVVVSFFNNPHLNSIHAVREMEELEGIPFYYDCDEELRIEIVYEAGRKILPYCFRHTQNFPSLPFVLVSAESPESVFNAAQLEQVQLKHIGKYDDNKRPENRSLFVRYVTLVTAKE